MMCQRKNGDVFPDKCKNTCHTIFFGTIYGLGINFGILVPITVRTKWRVSRKVKGNIFNMKTVLKSEIRLNTNFKSAFYSKQGHQMHCSSLLCSFFVADNCARALLPSRCYFIFICHGLILIVYNHSDPFHMARSSTTGKRVLGM